ncbi:MAG: hypothetical protein WAP35_03195 [Solirubrobacterales bacterium]
MQAHADANVEGADSRHLMRGANSLIVNSGATALLGIAFWAIAARTFSADQIGRDGALLAALVELSTVCQLNLDNALPRFLPALRENVRRVLAGAFAISGLAALVLGTVFVMLAPAVSDEFGFLRSGLIAPGFVLALIIWGWFTLQDSALVGLRRAPWVPAENISFGVLKIAALPVLAATTLTNGVFLAWVIPVLPLLIPISFILFTRLATAHSQLPAVEFSTVRQMKRRELIFFHTQDYFASVLARATTTFLPLLVVGILGSVQNAYFFIPFTMIIAFDLLSYGVATSLVVEGAFDESQTRQLARTVVRRFAAPLIAALFGLIVLAHVALLPFGSDYAAAGDSVLRILACASVFRVIIMLFVALERVAGRGRRILIVETSIMLLLIPTSAILASPLGINGIALGWTIANAVVAIALLPSVMTLLSPKGPTE